MLVPLGAFAMVAVIVYVESRTAIAEREAHSREVVASIEKGVPPPIRQAERPKPPERSSHPLKSIYAVLAVGIALWVGVPPHHRVWGLVVTALGAAGLVHWFIAGRDDWERRRIMEDEMHRAFVQYLTSRAGSPASGDGPHT